MSGGRLAAVGNVPDNTGYKILPDTEYWIILDIILYQIQDIGSNQKPDSWPDILVHPQQNHLDGD